MAEGLQHVWSLVFIGGLALAIFVVGKAANFVTGVDGAQSAPPPIVVASNDEAMNAAHRTARNSLGQFWTAFEEQNANEKSFSLKVRLPIAGHENSGEHMWVLDVQRLDDGAYSGRLGNAPEFVKNLDIGDQVNFSDAMVTDWMFLRRGKIVGNESMRILLARMPEAKAAPLRAMLETP